MHLEFAIHVPNSFRALVVTCSVRPSFIPSDDGNINNRLKYTNVHAIQLASAFCSREA